jgi:hypothetical protein
MPETEIHVERHEVFPTPVWFVDLGHLAPHRDALLADIDDSLATWEAPGVPGRMTRNDLQDRTGAHWDAYREALHGLTDAIAADLSPPWTTRSVHTWAISFETPEAIGDERTSLHNHARSTYTASLWLSVPAELEATREGATVLRNPQNHLLRRYGMGTYVRFEPVPMSMVVFPSFVEHFPERPATVDTFSRPRTLLVSDVHYY